MMYGIRMPKLVDIALWSQSSHNNSDSLTNFKFAKPKIRISKTTVHSNRYSMVSRRHYYFTMKYEIYSTRFIIWNFETLKLWSKMENECKNVERRTSNVKQPLSSSSLLLWRGFFDCSFVLSFLSFVRSFVRSLVRSLVHSLGGWLAGPIIVGWLIGCLLGWSVGGWVIDRCIHWLIVGFVCLSGRLLRSIVLRLNSCPSIHPSVYPSVRPSVCLSACLSVVGRIWYWVVVCAVAPPVHVSTPKNVWPPRTPPRLDWK